MNPNYAQHSLDELRAMRHKLKDWVFGAFYGQHSGGLPELTQAHVDEFNALSAEIAERQGGEVKFVDMTGAAEDMLTRLREAFADGSTAFHKFSQAVHTGRFSSKLPNIANKPKRAFNFLTQSDPQLAVVDTSAIELRMLAMESKKSIDRRERLAQAIDKTLRERK